MTSAIGGSPPFVPPWLQTPRPAPDEPVTTDDVGRLLTEHGFVEYQCDESTPTNTTGDTTP